MEFERIIKALCVGAALLLAGACQRPLYFAASEPVMLSRLEKAGDVQLQGAVAHLDYQQAFQATAAVAVSHHFALRLGTQRGADEYEATYQQYGLLQSNHAGLGGFYSLGQNGLKGSTWLGYSRGNVLNVNSTVDERGRFLGFVRLTNDYSRVYLEQQLRYPYAGMEFFAILRGGSSHVFNFKQEGNLGSDVRLMAQLERQMNNSTLSFASIGLGCSGGSNNLRLHVQMEHWMGPARIQLAPRRVFVVSTGLSWRFGTVSIFKL